MKKKMMKFVKKVLKRLLSGDKHVWGWVTLDISNPLPFDDSKRLSLN